MMTTQSTFVRAPELSPKLSDLGWLVIHTLRGARELVKARIAFSRFEAKEIPARNEAARAAGMGGASITDTEIARMSYVIPRLSDRLPWRSDCLIQAIAAQEWLRSRGIASEIQIGVEKPTDGDFGAHAWLICKGMVVTGGDISQYQVLLSNASNGD